MKKNDSVPFMLLVSLMTVVIGISGCAAAEKASQTKVEAAQADTEAVPAEFTVLDDYQKWAKDVGYPQGMLVAMGVDGINQDYFHTLPDAPGYRSGSDRHWL